MSKRKIAIGVDVGGSHISCKTYHLVSKQLVVGSLRSLPINNAGSLAEIIDSFKQLLAPVVINIAKDEMAGIGIAMPGPFDYYKGVALFSGTNAKFTQLNKVNMRRALAESLGLAPDFIRFINDATAFAVGEYFNGSLQGTNTSLAITLGTGFGAAFLEKGIPVIEDARVPKEGCLWYLPFAEGNADDYFSTRGLTKRFNALSGQAVEGVKAIADQHNTNSEAKAVFHDFGFKLIDFLKPWLQSFSVEKLVIGGNISKAFALFQGSMSTALKQEKLDVAIASSELLEDAAFIGAASLMDNDFYQSIEAELKHM